MVIFFLLTNNYWVIGMYLDRYVIVFAELQARKLKKMFYEKKYIFFFSLLRVYWYKEKISRPSIRKMERGYMFLWLGYIRIYLSSLIICSLKFIFSSIKKSRHLSTIFRFHRMKTLCFSPSFFPLWIFYKDWFDFLNFWKGENPFFLFTSAYYIVQYRLRP